MQKGACSIPFSANGRNNNIEIIEIAILCKCLSFTNLLQLHLERFSSCRAFGQQERCFGAPYLNVASDISPSGNVAGLTPTGVRWTRIFQNVWYVAKAEQQAASCATARKNNSRCRWPALPHFLCFRHADMTSCARKGAAHYLPYCSAKSGDCNSLLFPDPMFREFSEMIYFFLRKTVS